jgi:DNA-binding winged helix-turn-helix (wHTH) protein/Tfp pilus assembly protein PilF
MMSAPTSFRFDGWTLDRKSGELSKDELRTRLQCQPLAILESLLARPGELVTREELTAALWPHGVVDFDTALNSAVRRLRRSLGDDADSPRYVETIPRRGYRFIGQLDPPESTARERPQDTVVYAPASRISTPRWPVAIATLLVATLAVAATTVLLRAPWSERAATLAEPDARAQERYLRAEYFYLRRGPGDLELARRYFQEAVAIDPGYARAWVGLAGVYSIEANEGRRPSGEGFALARQAATQALELDPELAEAHVRLATDRWRAGDPQGARESLDRALAIEPDNALALSVAAGFAALEGRFDVAIDLQRRSVEAEPLAMASRWNLACWLMMAGRVTEARAEFRRIEELNPSGGAVDAELARLLVLEGRFAEALDLSVGLRDGTDRLQIRTLALHGLGRRAESDEALDELIRTAGEIEPFRVVEALAFRGESDQAFERLATFLEQVRDDAFARYSPFLRTLRHDPRWQTWFVSLRQTPPSGSAGASGPDAARLSRSMVELGRGDRRRG